ncbi:putative cinnamoyl-CoA reductase [Xylariaceae sp. FL0255]|nr:putative cinnamoyl-CoA reductase [Xylariaceae sp. FL0255]
MSASIDRRVIVVLNATSAQGNGVVAALLNDPKTQWTIRAVTRDASTPWAEEFRNRYQAAKDRVSLVSADVYDIRSLRTAFSGAYGVFAMIIELLPGKRLVLPEEIRHEVDAGVNIVDMAKQCGVKHFVMNSLPDMANATSGRFTQMYHMDHKFEVEQYARKELDCVTSVIPADGIVRFCAPFPSDKKTQWVDPAYDVGIFAAKIFDLGPAKTAGKVYPVLSPMVNMDEMAATFTRVTGRKAIHVPLSHDKWADMTASMIGPAFREDVKEMMEWTSMAPADKVCYGALDPEEDISAKELGVTASTFEDWMKRSGWTGPTEVFCENAA